MAAQDSEDEPEIRRYTVEVIIFRYAQDVGSGNEIFPPDEPETVDFEDPLLADEIAEWDKKIEQLDVELNTIADNPPPMPDYCMAIRDDEEIEDCSICLQGNSKRRGDTVPRGFLSAITNASPPDIPKDSSGRLQLAHWVKTSCWCPQ